jgi:CheY-like chemotaxis protein
VTWCARHALARAAARGLLFFYDFRGPSFAIGSATDTVADIARELLQDAVQALSSGCIVFTVDVIPHLARQATVRMQVAYTGQVVNSSVVQSMITAAAPASTLGAQAPAPHAPQRADEQVSQWCESLQGSLLIGRLPAQGRVARAEVLLSYERLEDDVTAAAVHGRCAWLIGEPQIAFEAMIQRLRRLGWNVQLQGSVAAAVAHLNASPASRDEVGLVLGAESDEVTLGGLSHLAGLLSAGTPVLLAQRSMVSTQLRSGGLVGTVSVFDAPLEPGQLYRITQQALALVNRPLQMLPSAAAALARQPRVLVAEDNLVNQLIATEMLRIMGFEVEVANNGEEAVRSCLQSVPALVLMDLDMPVLSGLDATRQLRDLQRQGRLPWLPIIAATARTTARDREQALQAGVDGFIEKPLDMAVMHAEICRLIGLDACAPTR